MRAEVPRRDGLLFLGRGLSTALGWGRASEAIGTGRWRLRQPQDSHPNLKEFLWPLPGFWVQTPGAAHWAVGLRSSHSTSLSVHRRAREWGRVAGINGRI